MKNKSIIIGGIVLSLMIVLSLGTYAYWTITRSQNDANTLIGGCLKIDITEEGEAIQLENAWPISDFEGMQLEGYTFKVTNDCEEPQDYRIDLDRLVEEATDKPMNGKYLAALLDYSVPVMYDDLESLETTEEGIKEKRVLAYDTVMGKGTNEHTLRLWIDETAPISEQGSKFLSKVQINAGQGIEKYYTVDNCFTFDSTAGSITDYDETCGGTDVVIPYEIGGEAVTQIGASAFDGKELTSIEFPRSVTYLDDYAVATNPNLTKVIFKDGLKTMGLDIFYCYNTPDEGACSLSSVILPKTLEGKLEYTFYYNSLKYVIVPEGVTSLEGTFAFNELESVKIGNNVTEILSETFIDNDLKEVNIPNSVAIIGSYAFSHNPIEILDLGNGVIKIEDAAFSNREMSAYNYFGENYLKKLYIPSSLISIGGRAFGSTTSDVIIKTERTKEDFLANVTTGNIGGSWYGNAQVISSDGQLIYKSN